MIVCCDCEYSDEVDKCLDCGESLIQQNVDQHFAQQIIIDTMKAENGGKLPDGWVECPQCGILIIISDIMCGKLVHGTIFDKNCGGQINPHSRVEDVANGVVDGCGAHLILKSGVWQVNNDPSTY